MSDNANAPEELETEVPDSMGRSILRSAWGLGLFAVITAGLIALTQQGTKEKIAEQVKKARSKALLQIVPATQFNNDLLDDAFLLERSEGLGNTESAEAFVALLDGLPTHIILPVVAPEGYSGPIRLVMSIDMSGTIKGLRVIEHKETPGLGDKIDIKKSDWVLALNGRSLMTHTEDQWKVKKDGGDIDQLTGATITPRAIVKAVYQALIYYRDNKDLLVAQALSGAEQSSQAARSAMEEGK